MSTSEHIRDGLAVTRYAGPGDTPGIHRVRFRIDDSTGTVYGLTIGDALKIGRALATLAYDSITSWALGHDYGRTDKSPT